MKSTSSVVLFLAGCLLFLTSCEAIAGIFKAGMWFGVIVVVIIVALVLWLLSKIRR